MEKRRIGEDFKYVWGINWNGAPEDFSDTIEMVLTASVYGKRKELERDVDYVVDGNLLKIDFTPKICTISGIYNLELNYVKPSDGFIDGERRSAVDIDAFQIVPKSAQITATGGITGTSDAVIGFYGLSAYEVWLKDNPESTKEDYYNWLRQPATDAVSLIDDKIEHLDEVIDSSTENESVRVAAETLRLQSENLRISAETERKSNEVERLTNEASRDSDELTRKANESTRKQDEATRKTNENERETAELTRQSSESERNEAEGLRINAESLRTTAESSRELAESLRVDAELLRQSSTQEAISNAESATENANTAAQNADNARLAIQDDLALKADQADLVQLESDVEQLAYVKIKNEVVNGNFENGLISPFRKIDGTGGESNLVINSSTPISGNYDARFTITTPAPVIGRPLLYGLDKTANIGDKIYLHFYAKILSGAPAIYGIQNGVSASTIHGGAVINGRNTRVVDVAGTSANLGGIYFDSRITWDMQMDNFIRINLTETFGAGNEPTKEEFELLLATLGTGYFEGEITIPAQKVMQWQLKLIRKNKNAIIALGGTII